MRKLENKKIKLEVTRLVWDNKGISENLTSIPETNYFKFFTDAAQVAPDGGWTSAKPDELKKRLELMELISPEKDGVTLEEDKYNLLVECMTKLSINATTKEAYDFITYLGTVPKEEVPQT